jgi:DNA invertase Pin-like site-specific DNA recombinase
MPIKRTIAVNEGGYRIGEDHHHAKLTDAQVEEIRELWEDGFSSYRTLAKKFNVNRGTIRDIVTFRRRAQYAARWKKV